MRLAVAFGVLLLLLLAIGLWFIQSTYTFEFDDLDQAEVSIVIHNGDRFSGCPSGASDRLPIARQALEALERVRFCGAGDTTPDAWVTVHAGDEERFGLVRGERLGIQREGVGSAYPCYRSQAAFDRFVGQLLEELCPTIDDELVFALSDEGVVSIDPETAAIERIARLQSVADNGDEKARLLLGELLLQLDPMPETKFVGRDCERALPLLHASADDGDLHALYLLVRAHGICLPENRGEATRLARIGAERGDSTLQRELATLLATDPRSREERIEPLMWLIIAAPAVEIKVEPSFLTEAERVEARRRAEAWIEARYRK